MNDLRTSAQAVLDLIDRMPDGVDCDEYDATVEALRKALASEPSVDAPDIDFGTVASLALFDGRHFGIVRGKSRLNIP